MKRRGPIARRTPLRATGRLRPRKGKVARVSKRASKRTPDASAYMDFVRTLSCIVCGCKPVDASHVSLGPNEKGIGMKVHDFQVVPHCRRCHQEWEERRGRFAGWAREKRWFEARWWVLRTHMAAAMNEVPTKYKEP